MVVIASYFNESQPSIGVYLESFDIYCMHRLPVKIILVVHKKVFVMPESRRTILRLRSKHKWLYGSDCASCS